MNQQITVDVIAARRSTVEGRTFANLFVTMDEPTAREDQADLVGKMPLKLSCDPTLIDALRHLQVPGKHTFDARMAPAAGGKMALFVTGVIQPSRSATSTSKSA